MIGFLILAAGVVALAIILALALGERNRSDSREGGVIVISSDSGSNGSGSDGGSCSGGE